MDNGFKERRKKNFTLMRTIYDLSMAAIILAMGVIMVFAQQWNISYVLSFDPLIRYLFGGLCFVYGGFRLYRGLKRDY